MSETKRQHAFLGGEKYTKMFTVIARDAMEKDAPKQLCFLFLPPFLFFFFMFGNARKKKEPHTHLGDCVRGLPE